MDSKDISTSSSKNVRGIMGLFHRTRNWFQRNWLRVQRGLASYLKSKAKNFPTIPPQPRRKVVEQIVRSEVFINATERFVRETGFAAEEVREKAKDYVKEIASDLNYLSFPIWEAILSWVFTKIYDGLIIDTESLEALKSKVGQAPIVFVPNHRSHMDYMLLSYVFYYRQLPMPYICAGKNMNFWPVGSFFRKSGAFFIRRRLEGNKLYAAALYAYLHHLLKENALMEFFIEGTRSRTGKLLPPRLGILSLLVKNFQEQADIQDIVFVPTSLVYESVIEEGSYQEEHDGSEKKAEGWLDIFRIGKYLKNRYGKVYVRFGEAIHLKDLPQPQDDAARENFVPQLGKQISYAINRHTTVTPTALVAMAVLTHPYPVVTEKEIRRRVDLFLKYLEFKQAPVSEFLLHDRTVAIDAVIEQFIGSKAIRKQEDLEGTFYQIPYDRRRGLELYKNTGVHFFISAAVVANIFLTQKDKRLAYHEIESSVIFLRHLLEDEFRFGSRKSLSEHIQPVLDFFTEQNVLVLGEGRYQVSDTHARLQQFAALLDSSLTLYWSLFNVLDKLPQDNWDEKTLIETLRKKIRLHLLRHYVMRHEAVSPFVIRQALRTCRRLNLLEQSQSQNGRKTKLTYRKTDDALAFRKILTQLDDYIAAPHQD